MKQLQDMQLAAMAEAIRTANDGSLLLAAYGSLPLKPEPDSRLEGAGWILGYRKDLCISVTRCRGTPDHPGRVAGLIPDDSARAMAMVTKATGQHDRFLAGLAARELNGLGYDPAVLTCEMTTGERKLVLGFVASIWHRDFQQEPVDVRAPIVAASKGTCGSNMEYLEMVLTFEQAAFGKTTSQLQALKSAITEAA